MGGESYLFFFFLFFLLFVVFFFNDTATTEIYTLSLHDALPIQVFITTHSDYIIKELNTLILLNKKNDKRLTAIAGREGYNQGELLASDKLKVYIAKEDLVQLRSEEHTSELQSH